MTSSYGNVIGTPRDQLPDISDTNYLATDADLTESVNEQIDQNIKDTKQFYDDMIEIEKNRTQALDKRLQALNQFISSAGKFTKALEADRTSREIDNVQFAGDKKSIEKILELQKQEKKQDFHLMEMEGLIKSVFESSGGEVDLRANLDTAFETLSDIELSFNRDENIRTQLRTIDQSVINGGIDALLQDLAFDQITDPLLKNRIRKQAEQSVRNKIHVAMLEAGYDISSGSYKKQFLKIVQPGITQYLKDRNYAWESTYIAKLNAKRKQDFKNRIEDYIGAINTTPAEGQDLTLFSDKEGIGLIAQIKATYYPNDVNGQQKAMMFVADTVAELVKNEPKKIPHAEALLEKLVYSDRSTKTDHLNIKEYLNSIDFEKEPKRYSNVNQFVKTIEDAITEARKTEVQEDKKTHEEHIAAFKRDKYQPLIDKINTRPNRAVTRTEAFMLLTEFIGDEDLYNPADENKQIPDWLNNLFTKVDVGDMDAGVAERLKFAKLINDKSSIITGMILERKVANGGANKLETSDLLLAKRLEDILAAELVEGTTGPVSQLDIEIRNAGSVESFINGRLEEIRAKFNAGEYDGLGQRLLNDGAEKTEVLRQAYNKDPSLLYSKDVHDGEAIHLEKALAYIKSGGVLNPEVIQYFKSFRFSNLKDEFGNPLTAHEIMLARLKATGAFEEDDVFGKRLKKDLEYLSLEDKKYLLTNGTHGVHNIITKEGGKYAKQVLKNLESIYANGEYGNGMTGYNYYNTAPARNKYGTNISAQKFGHIISERDIKYIARVAEQHPNIEMGMYGITGKQFLEIYNQEGFKESFGIGKPGYGDLPWQKRQNFDGDFQDYLVLEIMRYNLQRSNSIRGMEFDDKGRYVTKLSHFNKDEIEAMNKIFPNLKNMSMNQLQNLSPEIAKLVLNEVRYNAEQKKVLEHKEKLTNRLDEVRDEFFTDK